MEKPWPKMCADSLWDFRTSSDLFGSPMLDAVLEARHAPGTPTGTPAGTPKPSSTPKPGSALPPSGAPQPGGTPPRAQAHPSAERHASGVPAPVPTPGKGVLDLNAEPSAGAGSGAKVGPGAEERGEARDTFMKEEAAEALGVEAMGGVQNTGVGKEGARGLDLNETVAEGAEGEKAEGSMVREKEEAQDKMSVDGVLGTADGNGVLQGSTQSIAPKRAVKETGKGPWEGLVGVAGEGVPGGHTGEGVGVKEEEGVGRVWEEGKGVLKEGDKESAEEGKAVALSRLHTEVLGWLKTRPVTFVGPFDT